MFDVSRLKDIPNKPGCYLWLDGNQNIIYIGKAKNLNNRMNSYFSNNVGLKTSILVKHIRDFEFIVTSNEKESLILESSLVRKYNPKYNIKIKGSSMYPYVVLEKSNHPRLFKSWGLVKNKNQSGYYYFGPFPPGTNIREIVRMLNIYYPFRKCNRNTTKNCLYEEMGQCLGYSNDPLVLEKYKYISSEVKKIFNGNTNKLNSVLNELMQNESQSQNFEEAIEIKNLISNTTLLKQKDSLTFIKDNQSYDFFNYFAKDNYISFHIVFVRNKEIASFDNYLTIYYSDIEDAISSFLIQYYENLPFAKNLVLPIEIEKFNLELDTNLVFPQKGQKLKILNSAKENAAEYFNKELKILKLKNEKDDESLSGIKKLLNLKSIDYIEMFDISNTFGKHPNGAMAVFRNGWAVRSEFRHYNLEDLNANNDVKHMQEILYRRYFYLKKEKIKLPDLIIVDGGITQYNAANTILERLKINVPLISLTKNKEHKTSYIIQNKIKIEIPEFIFQKLSYFQNETHNFAIRFQRNKVAKNMFSSNLDNLKISDNSKLKLINLMDDNINIKYYSLEEIEKYFNKKESKLIFEYFTKKNKI